METDAATVAAGLTEAQRGAFNVGVVRGEADMFSDDARFSCREYMPENEGDPELITMGIFLGDHRWAMASFTPQQAVLCAQLILSRPAVRRELERNGK